MQIRIVRMIENMTRGYGRRRIAWRLYIHAVQDARWNDDPLPSNQELAERAKRIEAAMYREHLAQKDPPRRQLR